MKGVINKPDFIDLYKRLTIFLTPFFDLEEKHVIWKAKGWEEIHQISFKDSTFLNKSR